jgi:hypothetical protein
LSLPSLPELIKTRLIVLSQFINNELLTPDETYKITHDGSEYTVKKNEILQSAKRILMFMTDERNIDRLSELLSKISNFNIREFIKNLRIIFSSYHAFSSTPRDSDIISDELTVTYSKLIRALILGNQTYYIESSKAPILNLFDNKLSKNNNPYLRIRILQLLEVKAHGLGIGKLIEYLSSIFGEEEETVGKAIEALFLKGLIEIQPTIRRYDDKIDYKQLLNHFAYIEYCGKYHLNELLTNDTYLDEMKYAVDMPKHYYDKVFYNRFYYTQYNRMYSTLFFIDFLVDAENKEMICYKNDEDVQDIFYKVSSKLMKTYIDKMKHHKLIDPVDIAERTNED